MFPALHLKVEHWLFDLPEVVGGQPMRWVAAPLRYLYALLRDLSRGDLGLRAMSLVYSTLFAIVPMIAVAFAVLKAFGYHRELEPILFEFLRPLGDQGYELTASIMGFVENVQGTLIGTIGFAFLLYTVVSMIQKVEEALNFNWHVDRPRSLARRISEYLVVMLIGPAVAVMAMVLLASIEASSVVARLSGFAGGGGPDRGHLAPYVMVVGLFMFVYVYMPNTRVRLWPAFVGAVSGGVLWAAVGALFARIVVYSAKTAAVYAGFAVVLLFLVWVYLSWLILLLGAQLSFYVQHPEHLRTGHEDIPVTGALRERLALSVMFLVGDGSSRRRPLVDQRPGRAARRAGHGWGAAVRARGARARADRRGRHGRAARATSRPFAWRSSMIRHELRPRSPRPRAVAAADEAAGRADAALLESVRGRSLRDLIQPDE
jgi:membrane protein